MLNEIAIPVAITTTTAALLAIAIIKNNSISSFLYANARMAARTNYIMHKEKLDSLISVSSISEMVSKLKDSEYGSFLEAIDKNSISELNMALEESFINSLKEAEHVSPKKFKKVFDAYSKIFESKIIKTFFRSRFADIHIDRKMIEPIGSINPILLKRLHETKTIADIKLVLRDTPYSKVLEKDYSTIEEFDLELEKHITDEIQSTIAGLKITDKKEILDIFRKKQEIKKILTLIKFRIRDMDKKKQKSIIQIDNVDMEKTISSPDMKTFVEEFSNTPYYQSLKKALSDFEKEDNYYSFEKELLSYYLDFVTKEDLKYPIGPYPIISYLTKKEIEQKNLLIIAKGITSGMDKKEIKNMVIA